MATVVDEKRNIDDHIQNMKEFHYEHGNEK